MTPPSNTSSTSHARLISTHDDFYCRPISHLAPSFLHKLGPKTILVYLATPHPQCSMKHKLSFRSHHDIHDRDKWLMGAILLVGRLPPAPLPEKEDEALPDVVEEKLPHAPNPPIPPGAHPSHPAPPKSNLPKVRTTDGEHQEGTGASLEDDKHRLTHPENTTRKIPVDPPYPPPRWALSIPT